jgi:hypothetical protein
MSHFCVSKLQRAMLMLFIIYMTMLLKNSIACVATISQIVPSTSLTFKKFPTTFEIFLLLRHVWSLNRPQETEYLLVSLTLEIKAPKKLLILRKQGRSNLKISLLLLTTCLYYLQDNSFLN